MRRVLGTIGLVIAGWFVDAVLVRVALTICDSLPYDSSATETAYLAIAVGALAVGVAWTVAVIRRRHRGRRPLEPSSTSR